MREWRGIGNFADGMKLTDTLLTLAKVTLRSRPVRRPKNRELAEARPKNRELAEAQSGKRGEGRTLVVMGNGPSLRHTIDEEGEALRRHDLMAVNFAALTPDFFALRPRHYVLADPHFFRSTHANVAALRDALRRVDWPMTLHIPVSAKGSVAALRLPENIEIRCFNMTPGEGYDAVCHPLYAAGLAMPRPRNVLIPAIMEGIREGYGRIFITGADHTWPHTLYVDDRNRVVSVQPHFYEDNKKELDRVAEEYAGLHVHDVLGSMTVAFRSYHAIRRYADKKGVEILNATPGSLIDAFTRQSLS